jgi:hypothetical protein
MAFMKIKVHPYSLGSKRNAIGYIMRWHHMEMAI